MRGVPAEKRAATFQCVLVFYRPDGTLEFFAGSWEGRIHDTSLGEGGFGYDPIFYLPDRGVTVAQLPADIKNSISHRAQAFAKFKERLKSLE